MYKSIFERIKSYSSNPIDEYYKIYNFIKSSHIDNLTKLLEALEYGFTFCKELRSIYPSLGECIESNCSDILRYTVPAESYYKNISEENKELLLDEFLLFCQIILTSINYFHSNVEKISSKWFMVNINENIIEQATELIESSLNCFHYKSYAKNGSLNVEIIEDNPIAETTAAFTEPNISQAILEYIGTRDVKAKETFLHNLIDLIEPLLKKYSDQASVKKAKEYVQLIRHPETKKDEAQYKWFYSNKKKYVDELFVLCLYVLQYDEANKIIKEFETNKANLK